jgi:peptidyl-prolyl cis-trans isomerase C
MFGATLAATSDALAQQPPAGGAPAASQPAGEPDATVAIVNGEVIRMSDVETARQQLPEQFRGMPVQMLYPTLVNRLISSKLAAQEARREGLQKDPEYLRLMARVEEQLLERQYMLKVIDEKTTDDALKAQYNKHIAGMAGQEQVRARHILVATEADAKAVIAELNKGADFAELAKKRSTDPAGSNGGDLGFFSKNEMVPEFADAAFAMKPGEISQTPVKSEFGWHVIKVEERRVGPPPSFQDVEEDVRGELSRDIGSAAVEELKQKASIQRFDADGKPTP